MINKGVRAEVRAAMEPVCQRQKKLEDDQKCINEKLLEMSKEISDLKMNSIGSQPAVKLVNKNKDIRISTIDKNQNDDIQDEHNGRKKTICSARRTVGLKYINPANFQNHIRSGVES